MLNKNELDPLTRQPGQGVSAAGMSPMDPPDAYAPPALEPVSAAQLHPFLAKLGAEHALLSQHLNLADATIRSVQETGFTKDVHERLMHFVGFIDRDFIPHSRDEEANLFPLLNELLIAAGEHSKGKVCTTAVDVMKDDHIKAIQLAAVVLNFLRLARHLPEESCRLILLDAALRQAKSLVELLRLHVFREDNIVFSSAQRLISAAELDAMQSATRRSPQACC